MKTKLFAILLLPLIVFAENCKLVNTQCTDKSPTKMIDGVNFSLADACTKLGLSGNSCCWNSTLQYYCPDVADTCGAYRNNANCGFSGNTCIDKDYISGTCNKYQSKYSCANGYMDTESRVCTNVVCASYKNNESTGVSENHSCTPSPYGSDCAQYSSNPNCSLTHQGGQCIAANPTTVTCNPYNHECDDVAKNTSCRQTQAGSCADLKQIIRNCTVETMPDGTLVSDGCNSYKTPQEWVLNSTDEPHLCGDPKMPPNGTVLASMQNTVGGSTISANLLAYQNDLLNQQIQVQLKYSFVYRNSCVWRNKSANIVIGFNSGKIAIDAARQDRCAGGEEPGSGSYDIYVGSSFCSGMSCTMVIKMDYMWAERGSFHPNTNIIVLNFKKPIYQDTCQGFSYKSLTQVQCASGYQPSIYTCQDGSCGQIDPSIYSCAKYKCFSPAANSENNSKNFGSVIAYLQMGQNMAQDMKCTNKDDVSTCTLFSGKYFACGMYQFDASQPGSWNNNGADCGLNKEFFNKANVPTGYNASDKNLYSQATSGSNSVMGSSFNYGLSQDSNDAINNSVKLQQTAKAAPTNQDQKITYDGNTSKNSNIKLNNGSVVSVSINKAAMDGIGGFTSFKDYLSNQSVNLAWNRLKAEPDPNNVKTIKFSELGITRQPPGKPFGWNSSTSQPVINGLCVHLADYCEGGEDDATVSDFIKVQLAWAGSFTNPNFCGHCSSRDPIWNNCLTGEPRNTLQQWCCFSSKVALDINLAAYDQGLTNLYTGSGSRYQSQINHTNGVCGGLTVGIISKIDFSKGNYFKDLIDSIDISQIVDNTNFTNNGIQDNTKNRDGDSALNMVNEYKTKSGL